MPGAGSEAKRAAASVPGRRGKHPAGREQAPGPEDLWPEGLLYALPLSRPPPPLLTLLRPGCLENRPRSGGGERRGRGGLPKGPSRLLSAPQRLRQLLLVPETAGRSRARSAHTPPPRPPPAPNPGAPPAGSRPVLLGVRSGTASCRAEVPASGSSRAVAMATASAPALRREGSAGAKEEAYSRKMESKEEIVDSANKSEHENLGPQEEPAPFNPLLRACLTGDTEGVQQIFEDLEDPDHEKANRLLMEKDIVGRGLLYATCMAGQSDVIRTLARYGVDLKDKTAREAKQNLRNLILQIQTTITDPEKVQGRLNKEDKNISLKACQAKSDWLENTKEATMQDFLEQKQLLEDIMLPIFTKLATPRVQDSVNKKMGTPLAEH
ncbi:ankyrin repeat domain-containing protein 45 isoform X3 [Podarcis muralis]